MQQLGGSGCIFYNLSLAIYHVAVVKFQMKEKEFAKKLEPLIHFLPNGFAIVTAVFLSVKHAYAPLPEQHLCFIGIFPPTCIGDPDIECVRGGKMTPVYAKYLAIIPLLMVYLFIVLTTIVTLHEIAKQKRKSDRWRMRERSESCSCFPNYVFACSSKLKTRAIKRSLKKSRKISAKSTSKGEDNSNPGKFAKSSVASNKGANTSEKKSNSVRFSHQDITTSELRLS
jgi:hypothetical protein